VDLEFLGKQNVIPVKVDHTAQSLICATNDPLNYSVFDYLVYATGYRVCPILATKPLLKDLWKPYDDKTDVNLVSLLTDGDSERLKEIAFEAPVIKRLNSMVEQAVELRASDIHIEPLGERAKIRFRIDGILHDIEDFDQLFYLATVSRIKLLASLDIAEKRLPQDGKFATKVASAMLDIRVSTVPTAKGEGVVMRLLYRERLSFDIKTLGFEADHAQLLLSQISRPHGILLVTGPTGSGKTTTLYSMLTYLNKPEKKIVTVEDPVEYQLEGINQIQVKSEIGLNFSAVLRSVLRHDPDIIMVGEIRDSETAATAIQSALTGHLVIATLHTNDAPSSMFRLVEMGIEDYLINAAMIGAMAQRVVRKNCPLCSQPAEGLCSQPAEGADEVVQAYGLKELLERFSELKGGGLKILRGQGCAKCGGTGYRGRLAVSEVFEYTDDLKEIFLEKRSLEVLREHLRAHPGYRTLREDGLFKAARGLTTIEEVLRVC
jgi:type II secretory ATPase GspE/PulE/Tfp pilus assembly ATPase PilB-like protein